ncbi:MAG TPA: methyltransferase domain-containing protein, partial [Pirellulales bacterium]|nr:methyltransferase domain-containing protein [Pirellulales bacterium]
MGYLDDIDYNTPEFGDLYDELPLWSARFGLMLLEHVNLRRGMTILDVGAGTGFMTIELAQRCGAETQVVAVDPWAAAMK